MSYISEALRKAVYERAAGRCEYCYIADDDAYMPHEVDHIRPTKHRGETVESNLCLACYFCNRHKGSDVASYDPLNGTLTALYDPRSDRWQDHFALDNAVILPLTAVGRVTAFVLKFNEPARLSERQILIDLKRYP